MILLIHDNKSVISVEDLNSNTKITVSNLSIVNTLFFLSKEYDEFVIWIHKDIQNQLNYDELNSIFHHKKIMASFSNTNYFQAEIGYVHDSNPSINVNKNVSYGTWLMTSTVGGIHLNIIKALNKNTFAKDSFNYFLHSIAILGMYKESLFCYSEPKLLKNSISIELPKSSVKELFTFVYQHQKLQWSFSLLLNFIIFNKEIPLIALINSFFYKKRSIKNNIFDDIEVKSSQLINSNFDIDVIIPTIGRKNYLHDVLKDFSKQTILPKKIIIVEQNPIPESQSELDYITNEKWPFPIEHIFINQTGACNARNLALSKTQSEWVFLADDDNRFDENLLQSLYDSIKKHGCFAITTSYLQHNEKQILTKVLQWPTLGAGNSIIKRDCLKNINFDMRFEFGYGEDADFGMQLRNIGIDIIYFPKPNILHLKAPVGGFRTKPVLPWHLEKIQPKPSPTIMLFALLHKTEHQLKGYKTRLFIKNYKNHSIKNPFRYIKSMEKQWKQSVVWANYLKNKI